MSDILSRVFELVKRLGIRYMAIWSWVGSNVSCAAIAEIALIILFVAGAHHLVWLGVVCGIVMAWAFLSLIVDIGESSNSTESE